MNSGEVGQASMLVTKPLAILPFFGSGLARAVHIDPQTLDLQAMKQSVLRQCNEMKRAIRFRCRRTRPAFGRDRSAVLLDAGFFVLVKLLASITPRSLSGPMISIATSAGTVQMLLLHTRKILFRHEEEAGSRAELASLIKQGAENISPRIVRVT